MNRTVCLESPCYSPIGIFLATLFFKKRNFTEGESGCGGCSAGIMGCIGITKEAIPFVVSDMKRILPSTNDWDSGRNV